MRRDVSWRPIFLLTRPVESDSVITLEFILIKTGDALSDDFSWLWLPLNVIYGQVKNF